MLVFRCECEEILGVEECDLTKMGECPSCGRIVRIPRDAVNAAGKLRVRAAVHATPAPVLESAVAIAEPIAVDAEPTNEAAVPADAESIDAWISKQVAKKQAIEEVAVEKEVEMKEEVVEVVAVVGKEEVIAPKPNPDLDFRKKVPSAKAIQKSKISVRHGAGARSPSGVQNPSRRMGVQSVTTPIEKSKKGPVVYIVIGLAGLALAAAAAYFSGLLDSNVKVVPPVSPQDSNQPVDKKENPVEEKKTESAVEPVLPTLPPATTPEIKQEQPVAEPEPRSEMPKTDDAKKENAAEVPTDPVPPATTEEKPQE